MTLDLSTIASVASATHTADETLVGGTPAIVEHDQSIVNDETRWVGELGIAPWLAASAIVPLRVFDTHIRYLDPATGQVVQIENPNLHHHNEVLVGPGDPWLLARAATNVGGFSLSARIGTTLPIGSTVPNPFTLGDMGISHEHTQFGSGTFEPIVGLEAYRTIGDVTLDGYWLTLQSLYENGYGYRAGNRYAFGAGAASNLGTAHWRFRATLDRMSETAESWSGVVNTTEGNIGRVDVLAGLEASYQIDEDWRAALSLKVPVYTHVVGGQVDTPAYLTLTISTHEHLWRAGSHGGSAPVLEPVLGKITVFDFWAEWCQPCHVLDGKLADIARRHPDELVVRKVNVFDNDSPAWKAYLEPGGFALPHVKLYGRDGKLVWERSGAPAMLAAGVEDAIAGARVPNEPPPVAPSADRVAITITDDGFVPAEIRIPHGRRVVLVFTRRSETTCAVDVHFTLPDGTRVDKQLPLGEPVEVPVEVDRPGEIPYACGMAMKHGTIVVE